MENSIVFAPNTKKQNMQKIAHRLHLYTNEKQQIIKIKKQQIAKNCLKAVLNALESAWNNLMPIMVRGFINQYEHFNQLCNQQYLSDQRITKLQLQNFFQNSKQKYLIVICYDSDQFDQFKIVYDSLQAHSSIKVAPLCIKSSTYKNMLKLPFGYQQKCVFIICKGLFDQLLILKKINFGDLKINIKIKSQIQRRQQYEQGILEQLDELKVSSQNEASSSVHHIHIKCNNLSKKSNLCPSKTEYQS